MRDLIQQIFASSSERLAVLPVGVEQDLIARAQKGDVEAKEELALQYAPLFREAAARHRRNVVNQGRAAEPYGHIAGVLMEAFLLALEGFDAAASDRLVGYGVYPSGGLRSWFTAALNAEYRTRFAVSVTDPDTGLPADRDWRRYWAAKARAAAADVDVMSVRDTGLARARLQALRDATREAYTLEQADEETTEDLLERRLLCACALSALDRRERRVVLSLHGFDGDPATPAEVAHDIGVTERHVRRIRSSALKKMRAVLCKPDMAN